MADTRINEQTTVTGINTLDVGMDGSFGEPPVQRTGEDMWLLSS